MAMPGRTYAAIGDKYKYGFNGKESDSKDGLNAYDFGARAYDERLGRWMSTDAHQGAYPSLSPYSGFYNNPNMFIDKDGRDNIIYIVDLSSGKSALDIDVSASDLQTAVDAIMGKDIVQVVILKPEEFKKTKLDGSDAVIAYGEIGDVESFTSEHFKGNCLSIDDFFNPSNTGHPENSDPVNNIAGVVPSRVENIKSDPIWWGENEKWLKPGNSAQDALTMTFLHAVGHMTRNKAGHSGDEDLFNKYNIPQPLYNKNFMQKNTLPTILMNDADRDRWDLKLKTFHDFTFAPWNKLVFEKYFKQDFSKNKADNKMGGRKSDSNKKDSKTKKQGGQKQKKQDKPKTKKRKSEPSF